MFDDIDRDVAAGTIVALLGTGLGAGAWLAAGWLALLALGVYLWVHRPGSGAGRS